MQTPVPRFAFGVEPGGAEDGQQHTALVDAFVDSFSKVVTAVADEDTVQTVLRAFRYVQAYQMNQSTPRQAGARKILQS